MNQSLVLTSSFLFLLLAATLPKVEKNSTYALEEGQTNNKSPC